MQDAYFVRNDVFEYPNMEHMLNDCIINRNSCDNSFLFPFNKILRNKINIIVGMLRYEWSLGLPMLDYFN